MSRKSRLMRLVRTRSGLRVCSAPTDTVFAAGKDSRRRPVIFLSELDYVSRCILDYPDIETGGQLFGYWTEDGAPVVMYAIGPGRKANHQVTFFNQDVDYLLRTGNELRNRYGLQHIGEWHSHHRLGLARPSGHDANTMVSTIREKNLGRFLLCIGNTDGATTTFNPFMCDSRECTPSAWEVIMSDSPVRGEADRSMADMILHPRTAMPSHCDGRLRRMAAVRFPPGYWLNEESCRNAFTELIAHFQRDGGSGMVVTAKIDGNNLVHLIREGFGRYREPLREDILFPLRFPLEPPRITMTNAGVIVPQPAGLVPWEYGRLDLVEAVLSYESSSVMQYYERPGILPDGSYHV